MYDNLTFEQKLDELNDKIMAMLEEIFPEHSLEPLWIGTYNKGSGDRVTLPDGASFCLTLDHITEADTEDYEDDDDDLD